MAKTHAKVALGYSTSGLFMSTFTATPTLPSQLFRLTRGTFRNSSLDKKATFVLLAVAVCRLRDLSKFFNAFFTSAKDPFFGKIVHSFEMVVTGRQTLKNYRSFHVFRNFLNSELQLLTHILRSSQVVNHALPGHQLQGCELLQ